MLQYGAELGDPLYLCELAAFLTRQYGDEVKVWVMDCFWQIVKNHFSDNLVTTAGASSGLLYLLSILFPQKCPVYVEKFTYHIAVGVFHTLGFPMVPGVDASSFRQIVNKYSS